MNLRAAFLGLWCLISAGGPLQAQDPGTGVLIADLVGEKPLAKRGWPLHFYWYALRQVPLDETLVLTGGGGTVLNVRAASPGHWWISPEQTLGFPPGPATARVGQVPRPVHFVDPPPPPLPADQDMARRQALVGYHLAIGQVAEAKREAEDWVGASPENAWAKAMLGDVLSAEGRSAEALIAYDGALAGMVWRDRPPESLLRRVNDVYGDWLAQLPLADPEPPEEPEPVTLEEQDRVYGQDAKGQWAATATASSEYRTSGDYSASRATGAPDVTRYGDSLKAWASRLADSGPEWLELTYSNAVPATAVRVRQVFNPGAITKIEVFDAAGAGTTVFSGVDTNVYPANQIAWFVARFPRTAQPVQRVRITLDSARVKGWNEIDTVQLVAAPALPPSAPTLEYTYQAATGTLEIRNWPAGFVLERATRLAPADWQTQAVQPPVSLPVTGDPAFFRLVQAP
jgi:hypothetical protein